MNAEIIIRSDDGEIIFSSKGLDVAIKETRAVTPYYDTEGKARSLDPDRFSDLTITARIDGKKD
tara:strand:- start:1141 stop:1332 length:192 start_codon:yes stop_codon:yes gene_type:complete